MLSYAVRTLSCDAGIVITASHNPAQYNGYKVYGSDGCQITLNMANEILSNIESVDVFKDVRKKDFELMILDGSIKYIQSSVIENFLSDVKNCSINSNVLAKSGLEVIYTPLNGAGNKPVRSILNICGLKAVTVVPEQ
jgi:phosphoglucomutase